MNDAVVGVILGLVEGITEFIPVSSTGHLIVAGSLLGFSGPKASCFEVFIQLGAILAVVLLYRRRFIGLIPNNESRTAAQTGFSGWRGLTLLGVTTLPALAAGYLSHGYIKAHLFSPLTVAWALGVGGIAIILAEHLRPEPDVLDLDHISLRQAAAVGLFQCLSLWPGVSRAAATILGGMIVRMDRKTAAEYSFLAAVPVMAAATAYDLLKSWKYLRAEDLTLFTVGFIVSFLSAAVAVKTFIRIVQRWSLQPFAYYRILIAPIIYFTLVE
jgi:undecaprenyl-diphosphatase